MSGVDAIIPTAAGNNAIIVAVLPAILIQQFDQLLLASHPINLLLFFGKSASIANAFLVKVQSWSFAIRFMSELRIRCGPLVRHYTVFTKNDLFRQAIKSFQFFRHGSSP